MKCLLMVSNSPHSKHKAGFIVFHPERNNIISQFCPLTSFSWTIISHISEFGLIYFPPRTKRKMKKDPAYIYMIGGFDNIKKKMSRRILRYDMIRGEWFHCAKMKYRRANFTPFLYDGKIYLPGGTTSKITLTDIMEYYEPMMDIVYEAVHLPSPCSNFSCVCTKKNVFIIGGHVQLKNGIITPSSHFWSLETYQTEISEDSPTAETLLRWINIKEAQVPIEDGIFGHKAIYCEEKSRIYLVGGTNRDSESKSSLAGLYYTSVEPIVRMEENSSSEIVWYKRVIDEMQRSNSGVSLINNKIFMVGGRKNNFNSTFSITEVNEDDHTDVGSEISQSNLNRLKLNNDVKTVPLLPMPVHETVGYYDWRRKFFSDIVRLRHSEDIDLENVHTVVVDLEEHYMDFKPERYDWLLQWPLW